MGLRILDTQNSSLCNSVTEPTTYSILINVKLLSINHSTILRNIY